ncbi:hypothetical protein [Nocardiopsis sp. JB363]|uniref:hypothetical protein n=1 Tax=Nocardiopsis sp. JB363 TaxID=1434837 RepID=UPI00097A8A18|nr:hypothetical protein [Nocardiopsis sp. JB363]SIO87817.1 hypothetical protein BQ8420_17490 [Nocardiopsis sp. JB363]
MGTPNQTQPIHDISPPPEAPSSFFPPIDTAPHSRSKATRLLSAGTYLDPAFRDTVITELVEHPERLVPPSLGYNVATVLGHALRARNLELGTAALILLIWGTGAAIITMNIPPPSLDLFTGSAPDEAGLSATLLSCLFSFTLASLLSLARRSPRGQSRSTLVADGPGNPPTGRFRRFRFVLLPLTIWYLMAFSALMVLSAFMGGSIFKGLAVLSLPALLLLVGTWHRLTLSKILWTELSRDGFTGAPPQTFRTPFTSRREKILAAIDTEQFSPLALYNEDEPFLGAGVPHKPWSLTLELRPRPDAPTVPERLDGRRVLDLIVPRLAELTERSTRTSQDRLNGLELQECVFLPSDLPEGLRRTTLPYRDTDVRTHLAESTGEGAEQRRHFLRIRVGGWQEEVVTTIFLRVHTQGDLLVLEVLPYVLAPPRSSFHQVDDLTERSTRLRLSTLAAAPAVTIAAVFSGVNALRSWRREWWHSTAHLPLEGPRVSIREAGARDTRSMFQEMDINRYITTIQDRITSGTHQALAEAGYMTDEFQQQVVNVGGGGVFVGGSMAGSIATGIGAQANTADAPPHTEQG